MLLGAVEELVYSLLIALLGTHTTDDSSIQLYLSKSTNEFLIPINSTNSPSLDFNKETFFIVHGFNEDSKYHLYPELARALIGTGVNVITLDWKYLARPINYVAAVENVKLVGDFLGNYILKHKFNLKKVHVIGFSLGAHVAGMAGKLVKAQGGLLRRIFGLDPAGPMYGLLEAIRSKKRLAHDDAQMVITLSTNEFIYGTRFRFGKVNFIANHGTFQPGCLGDGLYFWCSHRRALRYYTETLNSTRLVGRNGGTELIFGNDILDSASGTYDFDTNRESPFGRG